MPVTYAMGRIVLLVSVLAAWGRADQTKSSGMQVDTIGDTIVIKALGSGPWGDRATLVEELRIGQLDGAKEYVFGNVLNVIANDQGTIYVLDRQTHTVRRYSPDGEYLGSIGRKGSGPGELGPFASGIAFMPDGRLLVQDFRNNRFNIYDEAGESAGQIPVSAGNHGISMLVDSAGHVYLQVFVRPDGEMSVKTEALKLDLLGNVLDTITNPFASFEEARVGISRSDARGSISASMRVPFMPGIHWKIDDTGRVTGGVSNRDAIDTYFPDGKVRRLTRDVCA